MSSSVVFSSVISVAISVVAAASSQPGAAADAGLCLAALSLEGVTAGDEERVQRELLSALERAGIAVECRDRSALMSSSCADRAACVTAVAERCRCGGLLELHGLRFGPTLSLTTTLHDLGGQLESVVEQTADIAYDDIAGDAELQRLTRALSAQLEVRPVGVSAAGISDQPLPSSAASAGSTAETGEDLTRAPEERRGPGFAGPATIAAGGVVTLLGASALVYVGLLLPGEVEANLQRVDHDGASSLVTEDAELYHEQQQRGALMWSAGIAGVGLGLAVIGAGVAIFLLQPQAEPREATESAAAR